MHMHVYIVICIHMYVHVYACVSIHTYACTHTYTHMYACMQLHRYCIIFMYYRSNVNNAFRTIHKCTKHFKDIPGCFDVATEIKKQIEDFKPFIPLIQGLRNQGMRNRHWEQVCTCIYVCLFICFYACVCI